MKDLPTFLREQLEVDTINDKMQVWLLQHPEEQIVWAKACDTFEKNGHIIDDEVKAFIEMTDIKSLLQFLQDDVNTDVSSIDPMQELKKIIMNR